MNLPQMFANQKLFAIKKAMYDFLKERFGRNEEIIERLTTALQTESDVRAFISLMMDAYETGYLKAVEDHREKLKEVGLVATVVKPN